MTLDEILRLSLVGLGILILAIFALSIWIASIALRLEQELAILRRLRNPYFERDAEGRPRRERL